MADLVKGKVLNERLRETWIDDHRLMFRAGTGLETYEYVLADARTGQRGPAFDHAAIAAAVGDMIGREFDPQRLPFERFALDGEQLHLLLEDDLRVFRVALGGNGAEEIELESAEAFRLAPTRERRSRDRGDNTAVLFLNRNDGPVRIIWLDRDGDPVAYGTIQPGEQHRQHTYVGHVWQILDADDHELGVFRARQGLGVAVIDSTQHTPPADKKPPRKEKPADVSPDGRWKVLIRDHNVILSDTESSKEEALTWDGVAEDHYSQHIHWSPDSKAFAVMRIRPEQEHTIYMIESSPDDQVQPKLHRRQYLKPGDRIAQVRPWLFDVAARKQMPVGDELFPTPWSITSPKWLPDGSAFTFLYNQRGHQVMRLIALDATTGAARAIIDEQCETFFDYAGKLYLHHVEESGEVIWMSERDGWNHLYLIDVATGVVKTRITQGPWVVRGVDHVDDENRQIWFRAVGVFPDQDPYHVHHGRVSFDGTDLTWLTEADGTHLLHFSPQRDYYIDMYSRVDLPPVHELRRSSDGSLICELQRADWSALLETGWKPAERFVAKGRDDATDIWGIIYYPSNFDPTLNYPVIENIYAGPHGHFVPKRFSAWTQSREIAELGFIVVRMDGMGTNWRSRAFHDVAWKNLSDGGFPDRIKWIEAAAADRPFMDLSRVGIYGGSAGGQSTLRALLAHGDFYHAGVADCGCHDNRMDKIWWNELWMSWPIGPHYGEQSNVTNAHMLEGDLLLIVGELDRNVDPASTMQVVDALIKADKDFELLVIPGQGHGAAETSYGRRRRQDFFVRRLLGVEPRWKEEEEED